MIIRIYHRTYGCHTLQKTIKIKGDFKDYGKKLPSIPNVCGDIFEINEEKLLSAIPAGFLPVAPKLMLLSVSDGKSGTGQRGLKIFRNWAKYFSCYTLDLYYKDASVIVKKDGTPDKRYKSYEKI